MILQRKFFAISCSAIVATLAAIRLIAFLLTPQNVVLKFDSRFAQSAKEAMGSFMQTLKIRSYTAKKLYLELKNNVASLSSLDIAYKGSRSAFVHLQAAAPLLIIKDINSKNQFVLSEHEIFSIENYDESSIKYLNVILLDSANAEKELEDPEFYKAASTIKQEIFENYKLLWRSKAEIQLNSKKNPALYIISDSKAIFEKAKLLAAEKIYKLKELKKNEVMKADIRFRDYVICTHQRGGWLYEDTIKK